MFRSPRPVFVLWSQTVLLEYSKLRNPSTGYTRFTYDWAKSYVIQVQKRTYLTYTPYLVYVYHPKVVLGLRTARIRSSSTGMIKNNQYVNSYRNPTRRLRFSDLLLLFEQTAQFLCPILINRYPIGIV